MSRPIRITLTVIGILVALVVIAGLAVYITGGRALARTASAPAESFDAPDDSAAIAQGDRLVTLYGCRDCHVGDLGGRVLIPGGPFGVVAAPNLTDGQGGIGAQYSDLDYERAIRHGIRPSGQSLVIMPSAEYNHLTDEDVGRIIAYVQQAGAVNRDTPPRRPGPIMRVLAVLQPGAILQAVRVDQTRSHQASVTAGPTVEYGRYLAEGCQGCHGPDFSGGITAEPGMPPSANITPDSATGIGGWSYEDFGNAVRRGQRPDGRQLSTAMPWQSISAATDDEVQALWLYLRTVPAVGKVVERG